MLDLSPPSGGKGALQTIYVLEMSSFQIDLTPGLKPDVAVLSNLTPDHIDRHGSMENYAAVKQRLLKQVPAGGQAIVGVDDSYSSQIFTALCGTGVTCWPVSVGKVLGRGVFALDGGLYDAQGERAVKVLDFAEAPRLPGAHNWQNAALAFAAVKAFVKDKDRIASAVKSFPGLAHRMELVGEIGKVRFINDSKATNADATARALACYDEIFWIAGGKAKEGGIESLGGYFPRIRKAYLIGEAAHAFSRTLDGKVAYDLSETLDQAVTRAGADAQASGLADAVVLLSPACASYDQFKDFEQRGDAFRALVGKLPRVQVEKVAS